MIYIFVSFLINILFQHFLKLIISVEIYYVLFFFMITYLAGLIQIF